MTDPTGNWVQGCEGRWPQPVRETSEAPYPWRQPSRARHRRYGRSFIQLYDTVHGQNITARQALTRTEYESLKNYFGEKLDTETRVKLCSCALVNLLRHAMGMGDQVQLAPDGSMTVGQILNMNVSRVLRMSISDIEEAMRENEREGRTRRGKYRFQPFRDQQGHLLAVRAHAGPQPGCDANATGETSA